jgi:hypothetical protein
VVAGKNVQVVDIEPTVLTGQWRIKVMRHAAAPPDRDGFVHATNAQEAAHENEPRRRWSQDLMSGPII